MSLKYKLSIRILILVSVIILSFPFIVLSQTPIDCGQTLSASISASGEKDSYTFSGSMNDRITIRARKTSGTLTPYLELYGPGGGFITSAANKIDRTLTKIGTYRIDVRDQNNTNMGNYVLFWERMNNSCNVEAELTCEQVVLGSIGTAEDPPPWGVYTFTASANDAVSIRVRKTLGGTFVPYMELYGPTGSYIAGGYNAPLDRTLTTAGTYKVLIRDYYNVYDGDFTLVWRKVSTPCSSEPINCGQVLPGSLGAADEIDFFTFAGSANDKVTIRARKVSGSLTPYLELYNPSGTRVSSPSTQIDTTLATKGTYKILVRDSKYLNTGDYAITWQKWNDPCALGINCGQTAIESIGIAADPPCWRYHSFVVSTNDIVTIRILKISGTFTPYIELYGPTGTRIGSAAGRLDKTLMIAGNYTIVVRDQNNVADGNYVLIYHRISNPCNAMSIECGQLLSGPVYTVGKMDAYTLTATGGDNVVLTLTKTSGGFDPSLELFNTSGARIAYQYTTSGDQVTIIYTLSITGTYTVFVSDFGMDEIGGYTLKFQKNNNSCPEVTVLIPNGGENILARSIFTIRWSSTDIQGISSQEIRLSTDGGQTFSTVIASGLQGDVQTYNWDVPADLVTNHGRIRVTVTDISGISSPDDSDTDFAVFQGIGRQYVYDELNRLIQVIYEDGRRVIYTYDAAGNRITLTNE